MKKNGYGLAELFVLCFIFLGDKIRNIQVIENYFLFLLINHDNKMSFST